MKRFMMLGIIALFSIAMLVGRAEAVPVTGDITFGGTLLSTLDLGTTTVVNFEPQTALVTSVAGGLDSTGIDVGSLATFRDFQFSPFVPNNPLWTTGGFSFNLTSVAVSAQTPVTLGLTGAGEVVGNGFDPTPYVWSFSADRSTVGGRSVVAFSATNLNNVGTAVPEPGSLLLLGSGLIGLGWLRRKRNS